MNGTRSIRELVGHTKTGVLLQGIARVLAEKGSSTRLWLERNGLHVTPIATGGDEFAILLQGNSPLSDELLQAAGAGYQREIADDPILRKSVNVSRPHMRAKFKEPPPDECPITVAHGAATLDEGILWAHKQDDDDHRLLLNGDDNFTEACAKIYAGTLDVADNRLTKNKRAFKKQLATTDPKLARFLTRTHEAQNLMAQLQNGKALVTNSLTAFRGMLDQFSKWVEERTEEQDETAQE
jgi:GGDEF domain-containing protein